MFKNLKRKKGFTLIEVIVSSAVMALVTAGIFATISALSQPASELQEEETAAFFAKSILDDWRSDVSSDTWGNTAPFQVTGWTALAPDAIGGKIFTPFYMVESVSGSSALKVTLNITW